MTEKVLHLYEAMFLVEPGIASDWEAAQGMVQRLMDRANAQLLVCRLWDERRLAYPIKKQKRAAYILCYFKADGSAIGGIERDTQLSEHLLRVLVLRADHVSDEEIEKIKASPDRRLQPAAPSRQPVSAHAGHYNAGDDEADAEDSDQDGLDTDDAQDDNDLSDDDNK